MEERSGSIEEHLENFIDFIEQENPSKDELYEVKSLLEELLIIIEGKL